MDDLNNIRFLISLVNESEPESSCDDDLIDESLGMMF